MAKTDSAPEDAPAEPLATLPARKRMTVVANAAVVNGLNSLAAFGRYELDDTPETREQIAAGLLSPVE